MPTPLPSLQDQLALPLDAIPQWSGAFSTSVPGWQTAWDSTSFGNFCKCPFYYYLTNVQGIVPRARSIHLAFGIAWHSALERFHGFRAQGYSYEKALHWTIAETLFRQLRTKEEKLRHQGYHEESLPVGPLNPKRPEKTPITLIRSLVQYLDAHKEDDLHTVILPSGKAAVELSFTIEVASIDDQPITYGGHMDRVVNRGQPCDFSATPPISTSLWCSDYKTTAGTLGEYYFAQFTPDIQMTGYSIGTRVVLPEPGRGIVVDAVGLSVTGAEFARKYIRRSNESLDEYLNDIRIEVQRARFYAEIGEWPQNRKACRHEGRDCEFRALCSNPNHRPDLLRTEFKRDRLWDPTRAR